MTTPKARGHNATATMFHGLYSISSGIKRDLTIRQLMVLLQLRVNPHQQTVKMLAKTLKIAKSSVTRAMDRLEDEGYGARRPFLYDKRQVFMIITPAGTKRLNEMEDAVVAAAGTRH